MAKENRLTKRQKDILEFIKKYSAKKKYPPSIREISNYFNLSSPATAHVHVKKLIEKGYLKRGTTSNHLLELQVPNEVFTLPAYLLPKKREVFTIRVEGDSMINAGILDKDIVIVERCKNAKNGDIVVAMDEEGQVTIKRFFRENDYIRLQPENDYMLPIIVKDISILGKAIGLYRKF